MQQGVLVKFKWPLMWKSTYEAVRRENYTLRDALKEANKEILKYRRLVAGLQDGSIKPTLKGRDRIL